MLILSRGKNESIIINDNIEVTIVEISSDQIKIGIDAPKDISINRKEIYNKIKQEMQQAADSELPNLKSSVEPLPQKTLKNSNDRENNLTKE